MPGRPMTPSSLSTAALIATAVFSLTACARSRPSVPVAQRVCAGAHQAAMKLLGRAVTMRIVDRDPVDVRCVLRGRGFALALSVRSSPDAFTAFNTTSAHQSQVFGPGVHNPAEIPRPTVVRGSVIGVWIPGAHEILATDAEPGRSGVFLTATVSGPVSKRNLALHLARGAAEAALAAHPEAKP